MQLLTSVLSILLLIFRFCSSYIDTGVWKLESYLDEFNNPTSEKYITTRKPVYGTFNNFETIDSPVELIWMIDLDNIAVQIIKEGGIAVKSPYEETLYNIKVQEQGRIVQLYGTMPAGGDKIYFNNRYDKAMRAFLHTDGSFDIKFTEASKRDTSTYLFKMDETHSFYNACAILQRYINDLPPWYSLGYY